MDTPLRPFPLLFAPHPWVLWALQGGGGGGRAVGMQGLVAAWAGGPAKALGSGEAAAVRGGWSVRAHAWMHGHRCPSLPARLEVLRDKQEQLGTHSPQGAPSLCPGSCPRKSFHSPCPTDGFPLITIRGGGLGGQRVTTEPTGLSPSAQRPAVCPAGHPLQVPGVSPAHSGAAAWGRVEC